MLNYQGNNGPRRTQTAQHAQRRTKHVVGHIGKCNARNL